MINVVAVQAEIEYRQQRLLQEAAQHRRASAAAAGRRTPSRRTHGESVFGGVVHLSGWGRRARTESTSGSGGSAASAA